MSEPGEAKEHRTVSRVTGILELAARSENGVRLADIADALNAPRSSVHGLVKGLAATGYLRDNKGTYTIGPAVSTLLVGAPATVDQAARPSMEELHRQFDETVMLCFLVGDAVVYIDAIDSTQRIRYSAPLRTRRPLYPTSSGKCFLALASERFRENYLTNHVPDADERQEIRTELRRVAEEGLAVNRGETLPDVSAVSVPIVGADRRLAAALAVAGPTTRVASRLDEFAEAAKYEAEQIFKRIAGSTR